MEELLDHLRRLLRDGCRRRVQVDGFAITLLRFLRASRLTLAGRHMDQKKADAEGLKKCLKHFYAWSERANKKKDEVSPTSRGVLKAPLQT